jgi:hypothetical protein
MADDDEQPGQGAGNEPAPSGGLPQLGVPSLGVPSLGTPQPSSYTDPDPNDPRNYPGALPPNLRPPVIKQKRRVGIARAIVLIIVVLAALGWVVRTVRQASATPADKAACTATLSAVTTSGSTAPAMMSSLEQANDKTLLGARGDMTTAIAQHDLTKLVADLNKVIARCRDLSSSFRSGFHDFCTSHASSCKQSFHLSPF